MAGRRECVTAGHRDRASSHWIDRTVIAGRTPPDSQFTVLSTLGGVGPGYDPMAWQENRGEANLAWETLLDLSATRPGPLHMRLAAAIRTAIRDGRLPVGVALPPSRMLAADLSVSRWTVTEAYSQLITEGYLTGKTGSATRVTWSPRPGDEPRANPVRRLPAQVARPSSAVGFDLSSYHPDLRAFPRRQWAEAIRAAAETALFDRLSYSEPGGLPELRAVLAEHLNRSRGASAESGTICVVMGAGQGMSRLCRALLADGHTTIGMENPGSPRLWQAAQEAGLKLVPLPVDDDGLVVDALERHPGLRAVCVGAARQIALGCPLGRIAAQP
jgi:GntR family transcriptional regulator / MocR family aminotransferase